MQQHVNVYAESMNERISARMLPLSTLDEIKDAMSDVQKTDDLYRDENGKLKVDSAWHQAAVLDFGDWLAAHMPDFSEALMCYNLGELPIIRDWMRYTAIERTQEINESIAKLWEAEPPTPSELAQAHIVADMLIQHGSALTVNVFGDVQGIENVYVPAVAMSPDVDDIYALSLEDMEDLSAEQDEHWTYLSELLVIALTCVKSDVAVLSYTAHLDDMDAFGMYLFADGHVANMPSEYYPSLLDMKMENEEALASHLQEFEPRSYFELCSVRMASAIAMSMQSQMQCTYEHVTKHSYEQEEKGDSDIEIKLSLVDTSGVLLQENVMGEYAPALAPVPSEHESLVSMFQAAIDSSPFVQPAEATDLIVSTCVAYSACELLLTGKIDDTNEMICDMFQELSFGLADIELIADHAVIIEDHEQMLSTYKELDINEEVLASLPEEQRSEIDWLLANIELDADVNRMVLSIDGEIGDDYEESPRRDEPMQATAIRLPAAHAVPQEASRETSRLLQQMCFEAFRSPSTTMFITSRGEHPGQVLLSAVHWHDGHWEDIGEDKAMFYIMATNIAPQLDILPGDDIDYRRYRS